MLLIFGCVIGLIILYRIDIQPFHTIVLDWIFIICILVVANIFTSIPSWFHKKEKEKSEVK
jgi:hypothetical protein